MLDQIKEKMKWREFVTPNDEADDVARGCHTSNAANELVVVPDNAANELVVIPIMPQMN